MQSAELEHRQMTLEEVRQNFTFLFKRYRLTHASGNATTR